MRKPFLAGNWKMFLNRKTGVELAGTLVEKTGDITDRDILVCPAFPLLSDVAEVIQGSRIRLGAQNMYFEEKGAFTGEVSAEMLLSVSCSHVVLGHSERRHIFGEDDALVNRKLKSALGAGLNPILCVGELLEERDAGKTETVVKEQVIRGLGDVSKGDAKKVIIAYEPVWAIGTGKTATPQDADRVQSFIRETIRHLYNGSVADDLRILYGGSVKPDNIDGLMAQENIDGALVGGASLDADSFLRIINFS